MDNILETLSIIITANTKEVEKATKDIKKSFDDINKGANVVAGVVAGATVAAGVAMFGFAKSTADAAGAIDDTSKRVGMSAEEWQKWAFAAEQSGIEADKLESIMKKQQTTFSDAVSGSEKASQAYADLGINIQGMTASGAFEAVIAKLAETSDITERNRIANDIFGKSYADLAPLLAEGATGIDALRQTAVDLGGVMSNEAVASGESFGDTLDQLTTVVNGLWNDVGVLLIPVFQKLADWVLTNKDTIFATFEGVMTSIGNAVGWIADNANWLAPILGTLVGIFVAFKVAMAAFNIVLAIQNATWLANPITWIVLGVVALIAAIAILWKNWDEVMAGMSKVFKGFGNGVIDVINVIIGGINNMIKWALTPVNELIKGWNNTIGKVAGKIPEISVSIKAIPKLASGGILGAGQAFIAGEAGKELIGSYNGKTTVMPLENTSFVSAIKQAVIEGFSESMGSGDTYLQVDGMTFAKIAEKSLNKLAMAKGSLDIGY